MFLTYAHFDHKLNLFFALASSPYYTFCLYFSMGIFSPRATNITYKQTGFIPLPVVAF